MNTALVADEYNQYANNGYSKVHNDDLVEGKKSFDIYCIFLTITFEIHRNDNFTSLQKILFQMNMMITSSPMRTQTTSCLIDTKLVSYFVTFLIV